MSLKPILRKIKYGAIGKTLRKIRLKVLWLEWFKGRGMTLINKVLDVMTLSTMTALFVDRINANFHTHISGTYSMLIVIPLYIIAVALGIVDFKFMHLIQTEGEISLIINPANYDKLKRIDENTQKLVKESEKKSGNES